MHHYIILYLYKYICVAYVTYANSIQLVHLDYLEILFHL